MAYPFVQGRATRSLNHVQAGGHVPQLDRVVTAPRGERLAVRAVRDAVNRLGMPPDGGPLLTRLHVPQPDRPVIARRGERLAVRAVRHPNAFREPPEGGLFEGGLFFARRHVPKLDRLSELPEAN